MYGFVFVNICRLPGNWKISKIRLCYLGCTGLVYYKSISTDIHYIACCLHHTGMFVSLDLFNEKFVICCWNGSSLLRQCCTTPQPVMLVLDVLALAPVFISVCFRSKCLGIVRVRLHTNWMPFLSLNQQCQSTGGTIIFQMHSTDMKFGAM